MMEVHCRPKQLMQRCGCWLQHRPALARTSVRSALYREACCQSLWCHLHRVPRRLVPLNYRFAHTLSGGRQVKVALALPQTQIWPRQVAQYITAHGVFTPTPANGRGRYITRGWACRHRMIDRHFSRACYELSHWLRRFVHVSMSNFWHYLLPPYRPACDWSWMSLILNQSINRFYWRRLDFTNRRATSSKDSQLRILVVHPT